MAYSIKSGSPCYLDASKWPPMPVVPQWLINRLREWQHNNIHFNNGVWELNGKVVSRFDKTEAAKFLDSIRQEKK